MKLWKFTKTLQKVAFYPCNLRQLKQFYCIFVWIFASIVCVAWWSLCVLKMYTTSGKKGATLLLPLNLPNAFWFSNRPSVLWHCWLGGRKGVWPVKKWGDGGSGHWLVQMEWCPAGLSLSASANLPLDHKVQKFSSGTGSPGGPEKRAEKWLCVCVCVLMIFKSLSPADLAVNFQ